jgi:enoyl-[acyl-carrier-protein] reductase (NADH)
MAAVGVSAYSMVSMMRSLGPLMGKGGSAMSLTYLASERAVPFYGGGMSSAKAALESDTRMLAFEAGRSWGVRVNTISAGPFASRAATAIGVVDQLVTYCAANSPDGAVDRRRGRERGRIPGEQPRVRHHRDDGLCRQGLPRDGHCRRGAGT